MLCAVLFEGEWCRAYVRHADVDAATNCATLLHVEYVDYGENDAFDLVHDAQLPPTLVYLHGQFAARPAFAALVIVDDLELLADTAADDGTSSDYGSETLINLLNQRLDNWGIDEDESENVTIALTDTPVSANALCDHCSRAPRPTTGCVR